MYKNKYSFIYRQDRDKLVIATKCGRQFDSSDANGVGATRKNIVKSVDNSLKRLQTDYLDLLYVSGRAPWNKVS